MLCLHCLKAIECIGVVVSRLFPGDDARYEAKTNKSQQVNNFTSAFMNMH